MGEKFGLTPEAIELIKNFPSFVNDLAHFLNTVERKETKPEPLEPIEISAVTYSPAECGYEK